MYLSALLNWRDLNGFFFNFLLIPSLIKELIFHFTFCQCPPAKDHTHRNAPTVDKAGLLGWVAATQANTSHGVTQNVLESTNIGFESAGGFREDAKKWGLALDWVLSGGRAISECLPSSAVMMDCFYLT